MFNFIFSIYVLNPKYQHWLIIWIITFCTHSMGNNFSKRTLILFQIILVFCDKNTFCSIFFCRCCDVMWSVFLEKWDSLEFLNDPVRQIATCRFKQTRHKKRKCFKLKNEKKPKRSVSKDLLDFLQTIIK
jgi:hypothetical protein